MSRDRLRPRGRIADCASTVLGLVATLAACTTSSRKLDDAMLYDGPEFQLKVTRYLENLPFHFTGEVFRVACASANTRQTPAAPMQEAGWRTLGNGSAIGTKTADEVVDLERNHYRIVDNRTLVWIGNGVSVSFDACGTFHAWYPRQLLGPNPDLRGDQAPRYEAIQVTPDGEISFVARSPAFGPGGGVRIRSTDRGVTWQVDSTFGGPAPASNPGTLSLADSLFLQQDSDSVIQVVPGVRAGPVTPASTFQSLRTLLGEANVSATAIEIGEGFTEPGVVLFPDDPTRRATIHWQDTLTLAHPVVIEIRDSGTVWTLPVPITIGTSLDALERLNGRPFTFSGFGWDYGGGVGTWNGGALDTVLGKTMGLNVILSTGCTVQLPDADLRTVYGDHQVSSESRVARALCPRVEEIRIYLAP